MNRWTIVTWVIGGVLMTSGLLAQPDRRGPAHTAGKEPPARGGGPKATIVQAFRC